jgi:hypothetical protein
LTLWFWLFEFWILEVCGWKLVWQNFALYSTHTKWIYRWWRSYHSNILFVQLNFLNLNVNFTTVSSSLFSPFFRVKVSKIDPNNQKFKDSNLVIMDTSGSDVYYDLHHEVCDKNETRNREYLIVLNCLIH